MKALKRFFARICSRFKKKTEETENDTPEETEKETPKKHRQEETGSLSSKSQKSHRNVKLYSIRKEAQMASKRDSRSSRSQRTQTSGRRLSGEATGLRSDKTLPSVRSPSGDTTTSRSRKSSSRSRKSDTSTTSRSKRTPSALSEEEVEEKSGTLSRILELSERVTRKVRTFVSRPIRQPAMRKFIARLELRKQAELAMKDQRKLNDGDVSFPREKMKRAAERAQSGPPEDMFINVSHDSFACLPSTSVAEETNLKERTETGCALVTGNNDNDGQVIVDGHPFWLEENENEDTDTADDLPLNAEVVLDVDEGKIQLATIPKIPVVLDPFGDFSTLQKRDKLFFNKALLFGNSVRSMINLSDMTSVRARRRTKRNKGKPNFITPTTRYFYTREKWWRLKGRPFTPTEKDAQRTDSKEDSSSPKSAESVGTKPSGKPTVGTVKKRQHRYKGKGGK